MAPRPAAGLLAPRARPVAGAFEQELDGLHEACAPAREDGATAAAGRRGTRPHGRGTPPTPAFPRCACAAARPAARGSRPPSARTRSPRPSWPTPPAVQASPAAAAGPRRARRTAPAPSAPTAADSPWACARSLGAAVVADGLVRTVVGGEGEGVVCLRGPSSAAFTTCSWSVMAYGENRRAARKGVGRSGRGVSGGGREGGFVAGASHPGCGRGARWGGFLATWPATI